MGELIRGEQVSLKNIKDNMLPIVNIMLLCVLPGNMFMSMVHTRKREAYVWELVGYMVETQEKLAAALHLPVSQEFLEVCCQYCVCVR